MLFSEDVVLKGGTACFNGSVRNMPAIFLYLALATGLVCLTAGQDDFSDPIKCYDCKGDARNSSCADPVDVRLYPLPTKECIYGVCLKWTYYKNKELQIERTCSADIEINIMLVDGVCRSESFGNGYLCMCGRHLCNGGNSRHGLSLTRVVFTLILSALTAVYVVKIR